MTTIELKKAISDVLSALSSERVLVKYLFILARGHQQLSDELLELVHLRNRTQFFKHQQGARDRFEEIRKQADTFPPGQVFHEAIRLLETLREVRTSFEGMDGRLLDDSATLAERFYKAAEEYARAGNDESFSALLIEAGHFYPSLVDLRQSLTMLRTLLFPEGDETEAGGSLSIVCPHTDTLDRMIEKLAAIERAYVEICQAANLREADHPLRVVRLETGGHGRGGLRVVVQGEARMVEVLGGLVGRFAQFLYRRLGIGDGEIYVSDRVLANQALVNLTDELERVGFRFGSGDEPRLQKAALLLRRDLVTLLAGEPTLRVNEQHFEVEETARTAYVTESMQLLPKYSTVVHLSEQTG